MSGGDLPAVGDFEDPGLPLKVILVFVADGGWHLQSVLLRTGDGHVTYLPPYSEPWSERGSTRDWQYLSERIVEGRGGNGHTYEVEGFAANVDDDIEAVVTARAAEVVASSGGPLGEIAHTISFAEGEETVSMPFVVLPDEEHDHMLVATDAVGDSQVTVTGDGTTAHPQMTFRSVAHWQRDLQRCWQLDPGVEHEVIWDRGRVFLTIDDVGSIVRLAEHPSTPLAAEPPVSSPLQVDRFTLPLWGRLGSDSDVVRAVSAEDAAWGWAIPSVLRAAAGPAPDARCPAAPGAGDEIEAATGYWEALLHLLLYSFGWARPDRGLRWWYEAGHPTDDHRLRLVAETYLADGQLDWFATWLWSTTMPPFGHQRWLHEAGLPTASEAAVEVDRAWLENNEQQAVASGIPAPIGGGSDPLHLEGHCAGPLEEPDASVSMNVSTTEQSAVLVADSAVGWYRGLSDAGTALPGDPDVWTVDLVVVPVGWIGAFSRSPQTGLWFTGDLDIHLRGN
jgi:hypothetical protein